MLKDSFSYFKHKDTLSFGDVKEKNESDKSQIIYSKMIKLIIKFVFVMLVFTNPINAQNPVGKAGVKYWIKNESHSVQVSKNIKNILNFHPAVLFNLADSTLVDEGTTKSEFSFFAYSFIRDIKCFI